MLAFLNLSHICLALQAIKNVSAQLVEAESSFWRRRGTQRFAGCEKGATASTHDAQTQMRILRDIVDRCLFGVFSRGRARLTLTWQRIRFETGR